MSSSSVERLDLALVEQGLVDSRAKAQALIMAGEVQVDGQIQSKSSYKVSEHQVIELKSQPRYVSRGGEKLAHALERFHIDVTDRACADLGASTGGFTDCLLQAGAAKIYAIDVGYGQLEYRLRIDERVEVMERTNARYIRALPEPVSLVTADLAFISLDLVLDAVKSILKPGGVFLPLIKPQFEAGRDKVERGGVVRDPKVHAAVIEAFSSQAAASGFAVLAVIESPLRGPAGNVEFLGHLVRTPSTEAGKP